MGAITTANVAMVVPESVSGGVAPTVPPGRIGEVDRLLLLARLLEGGQITPEEFQGAKGRLLASLATRPAPTPPDEPESALTQLRSMHDRELVDDDEYELLQRATRARS
jgi:Short C-terminal domain